MLWFILVLQMYLGLRTIEKHWAFWLITWWLGGDMVAYSLIHLIPSSVDGVHCMSHFQAVLNHSTKPGTKLPSFWTKSQQDYRHHRDQCTLGRITMKPTQIVLGEVMYTPLLLEFFKPSSARDCKNPFHYWWISLINCISKSNAWWWYELLLLMDWCHQCWKKNRGHFKNKAGYTAVRCFPRGMSLLASTLVALPSLPLPISLLSPSLTPIHLPKSKTRIFVYSKKRVMEGQMDGQMDQRTDQWMDRPSYRDARTHRKTLGSSTCRSS